MIISLSKDHHHFSLSEILDKNISSLCDLLTDNKNHVLGHYVMLGVLIEIDNYRVAQ